MASPQLVFQFICWGHDVNRWHTFYNLRPQNVAAHSWAVAMMVSSLYEGPAEDKLLLIRTALEHDLVEKIIGDMPRTGRTLEHKVLESEVARDHGTLHESMLPTELALWLEWADLIEAGLQAQREFNLGNKAYEEVVERVGEILTRGKQHIPPKLWEFAARAGLTEEDL